MIAADTTKTNTLMESETYEPPRNFLRLRKKAEKTASRPDDLRSLATRAYAKYTVVRPQLAALREDLPTLIRLARAYALGTYRKIPWKALVSAVAAILYFVMPLDAIPDFIPIIGYLDDAAVIAYGMRMFHGEIARFAAWEQSAQ
jgi:uncharacterized membrane protein YkvA (DUF1232 family)